MVSPDPSRASGASTKAAAPPQSLTWLQQLVLIVALLLGGFGTLYGAQSLKWARVPMQVESSEDVVYLPGPMALKAATLGVLPFGADLIFIRAHAYFLKHMYSDRIFSWLESYVMAAVALDPDNRELYHWAATNVRLGQEIDERVLGVSNRYAEMGIARFPDDPRFYEMIAFNQYFELRPRLRARELDLSTRLEKAEGAERAALLAEVTEIRQRRYDLERSTLENYTVAAMLPGSSVNPLMLVNLYVRQDEVAAATQLTRALFADAPPQARESLLNNLENIGQKGVAAELRAIQERHRAEMPFVPETLFDLIGSSDSVRVPSDWNELGRAIDDAKSALDVRRAPEAVTPPSPESAPVTTPEEGKP